MPPGRNWPKRRTLLSRRHRVEVHFGEPIWPRRDEPRHELMERVRSFLEDEASSGNGRSRERRRPRATASVV